MVIIYFKMILFNINSIRFIFSIVISFVRFLYSNHNLCIMRVRGNGHVTYQCCRSRRRRGRAVVAGVPPWGGAHLDCRGASCAPCTSAQAPPAIDPWINQTSAATCHCLTCLGLLLATTCFCRSHNVIVSERFVRQAVCTPRVTWSCYKRFMFADKINSHRLSLENWLFCNRHYEVCSWYQSKFLVMLRSPLCFIFNIWIIIGVTITLKTVFLEGYNS